MRFKKNLHRWYEGQTLTKAMIKKQANEMLAQEKTVKNYAYCCVFDALFPIGSLVKAFGLIQKLFLNRLLISTRNPSFRG